MVSVKTAPRLKKPQVLRAKGLLNVSCINARTNGELLVDEGPLNHMNGMFVFLAVDCYWDGWLQMLMHLPCPKLFQNLPIERRKQVDEYLFAHSVTLDPKLSLRQNALASGLAQSSLKIQIDGPF